MKILYAIQGTGNGHITRAREVAPVLEQRAEVDYLISGCQVDLPFPYEVKYKSRGMSLIFGKKGGIDIGKTFRQTSTLRLNREVRDLPVERYDLVLNDFEPVSAWAAKRKGVRCVALSHQSALRSGNVPGTDKNAPLGKAVIRHYAPADSHYGFHFDRYDDGIYTPIIRNDVRSREPVNHGHYTVYLPAYGDRHLIGILSEIQGVDWQVFSKHARSAYQYRNVSISPIHGERFTRSLVTSEGILCGAGFETPSEALYLGKKLMVIPMSNQYEQYCNAMALKKFGIPVLQKLDRSAATRIMNWVENGHAVKRDYKDETSELIDHLLSREL